MAKAKLLQKNGITQQEIDLPEVFSIIPNEDAIKLAVKVYLDNQRQSNAHTKTRGEVSGSTRKLYRQKGTGNARRGSIRSPIMRGGGIVFGPKNTINYKKNINKKVKKLAIVSALSLVANKGDVFVFETVSDVLGQAKTKSLQELLSQAELKGKVSFVIESKDDNLLRAASNIPNVSVKLINDLNAYSILNMGKILFSSAAVETINNTWKK